jgi:DNA uptake protein ComE-like DNA-binding protein
MMEKSTMPIDLNTASRSELDAVPGLEGHGFEIVRYRDDRGRFSSLRELNEVPGLANKVPNGLEAYVVIG